MVFLLVWIQNVGLRILNNLMSIVTQFKKKKDVYPPMLRLTLVDKLST